MLKRSCLMFLFCVGLSSQVYASGLVIHAAEIGIGRFHREDNRVHPYDKNNVWSAYLIAENATITTPLVTPQTDGSYGIIFSSLEELLLSMRDLSRSTGQKVSVFNLNGHGLPGGMWFPKDAAERDGSACDDWLSTAHAPDSKSYNDYYSSISYDEIMQIRYFSEHPYSLPCVTGKKAWNEIVTRIGGVQDFFDENIKIRLASCVVGLGKAGNQFTRDLAELLIKGNDGALSTAIQFGLGDWSMPEGMGFWDFQSKEQIERDAETYPSLKKDRDFMQKGTLRVGYKAGPTFVTKLVDGLDFMLLGLNEPAGTELFAPTLTETPAIQPLLAIDYSVQGLGESIRIPGTKVSIVKH